LTNDLNQTNKQLKNYELIKNGEPPNGGPP